MNKQKDMTFDIYYGAEYLGKVKLSDFAPKKLTKTKAREIARELAPIVEDYIPEWDRYHKRVTIKALAEDLLCDLEHTRYSIEEIMDNAVALKDWDTVHKLCASGVWSY